MAARARLLQCRALASLGQPQPSMAAGADAGRIYREAGDLGGEAQAFHATAEVPLNQGDLKLAKTLYQQALAIARKIGDKRATARELGNIGLIFAQEGDFATGEKIYGEALADFRDVGDKHGMSVVIGNTGDIFHAEGRLGDALAEIGMRWYWPARWDTKARKELTSNSLATFSQTEGDLGSAVEMYQRASDIQREIDDTSYYAATLVSIGRVRRQRGDSDGAKKAYQESLALRERLGEKGTGSRDQGRPCRTGLRLGSAGTGREACNWSRPGVSGGAGGGQRAPGRDDIAQVAPSTEENLMMREEPLHSEMSYTKRVRMSRSASHLPLKVHTPKLR